MLNSLKEENKNNTDYISLKTEQNFSIKKNVQFLSENLDNKNIRKSKLNLEESIGSKTNDKFIKTGSNIFNLKSRSTFKTRLNKKNHVIRLKNNMLFNKFIPGCTPYDPYLIKVCKNAIIHVKDQLPNYKEVIERINTEFGIEEDNKYNKKLFNDNKFNKTYNTFAELKTNYIQDNEDLNDFQKININKKFNLETNTINNAENNKK